MGLFGPTGGGGASVTSVNGQTGVVSVTANNIGAEAIANKNQPSGYAGLDASSLVALANLPVAASGLASQDQIVKGNDSRLRMGVTATLQAWNRSAIGPITMLTVAESANLVSGDTIIISGASTSTGVSAPPNGSYLISNVTGQGSGTITCIIQTTDTSIANGFGGTITRNGLASRQAEIADWTITNENDGRYIANKPAIPAAQIPSDWDATTGVSRILNKPTIPAAPVNADWNATSGLAQILNRPTNAAAFNISTWSGDGTTTTINATGHSFLVGQTVTFRNTGSTILDGLEDVPVLSRTTNTFTIASTVNGSGFGGMVARRGLIGLVQLNQLQTAQQTARSVTISSWTANGTTATISATNHQYFSADSILITGAGAIDGTYTITATSADQFTFATSVNATGTGGVAVRAGRMSNADKVTLDGIRRNVFGPMIILRFANWGRGQTGYGPGNPPTGMSSLTPTSGNVVENFNPDQYHPRLFNGGQFFGVGRQYKLICAVRCDQIAFDGVHCQLRYYNGSLTQIVPGLMDFGGGNDGIVSKSYFATSDTLTAVDEWWTFVPFFGAFNGSNFARIQDCVVVAYLV